MKVCSKCGEINKDESPICKNCSCSSDFFEDYNEVKNAGVANLKSKNHKKNMIFNAITILYTFILVSLLGLNLFNSTLSISLFFELIILVLISILCIKFTGTVFFITHIFSVKDVDESDMSDMYDTLVKSIGICSLVYSLVTLIQNLIK